MAEFLVEVYLRHDDLRAARQHTERAERTAADLCRQGRPVRCVRSIFIPEDETFLLLYRAVCLEVVEEAVSRSGLSYEHISVATSSRPAPTRNTNTEGNTLTQSTLVSELRDKQQKVWSSGDYNKIAALTVPLSEFLVDHVGVTPQSRVLDVATGTGHAALAAARRGAVVSGIDYVPTLLDIARSRADAEDLEAEFAEADAEHLPYGDGAFDYVLSAIGVMFSADHQRAAQEMVRVCRPGGTVATASWTQQGFVGGMLATVGRHVSPPPGAQPATRWGDEAVVAELLGDEVLQVRSVTNTVTQRFIDADAFADLFLTYYGPTFAAASRLTEEGRTALRSDLVALAERFDRGVDDALVVDWEYRVVTATKGA
jgi:ubiquinone/menaquinone biosynthesis C-methylase UbiE